MVAPARLGLPLGEPPEPSAPQTLALKLENGRRGLPSQVRGSSPQCWGGGGVLPRKRRRFAGPPVALTPSLGGEVEEAAQASLMY